MVQAKLDRHRYVLGDASAHVGLLNVERISDRRHIHSWQVDPHYHEGLAQLFLFERGGIKARIDYEPIQLDAACVLWLPALCNHGFLYPENADGWVLTIPTSDVARLAKGRSWMERWIHEPRVLRSTDAPTEVAECAFIARKIGTENGRAGEERNIVLEALFMLLMVNFHRGLLTALAEPEGKSDNRRHLLNRFQALLDQHLQTTRAVADYASMLSITPTHLSRSIKSVCGRTAGEIIHDRVMLAAKRALVFSDKSVTQIAYDLKFSSPSYFTRFFVQQEGETPRKFRDRVRASPSVAR